MVESRAVRVLLVALVVGVATDVFLRGRFWVPGLGGDWPGLAFPVLVGLCVAALVVLARAEGLRPNRDNLWLVAALAFVSAAVAVRADPALTLLNIASAMVLLVLVADAFAGAALHRLPGVGAAYGVVATAVASLARPVGLVSAARRGAPAGSRPTALAVLRGILLAVPALVVFGALLASADLLFADWLDAVFGPEFLRRLVEWGWRGVVVLVVTWLVAGALDHALRERDDARAPWALLAVPRLVGRTEGATVLAAVSALFVAFLAFQARYLFGGGSMVAVGRYTYAEYARRGFFELIAVAVLSIGLVLVLRALVAAPPGRTIDALGAFVVALVLVILSSAWQRLALYEEAYGLTWLRLVSHVFMIWLVPVLLWAAATQWRWRGRFALGAALAALGFVVTLNVLAPDAFVARYNIERGMTGVAIAEEDGQFHHSPEDDLRVDAAYLGSLSDDAVPAVAAAAEDPRTAPDVRAGLAEALDAHAQRLASRARPAFDPGWLWYNRSGWAARELLETRTAAEGSEGAPATTARP